MADKEYYVTILFAVGAGGVQPPVPKTVSFDEDEPRSWGVKSSALPTAQLPGVTNGTYVTNDRQKSYVYVGVLTDEQAERINKFGSLAVVESPVSGMTLVTAVKAEELDYSAYSGPYKYIVQIVDTGPYEERKEKVAKRLAIKKHLERMAAEARDALKVEELLAGNEEAQKLMAELRELSK